MQSAQDTQKQPTSPEQSRNAPMQDSNLKPARQRTAINSKSVSGENFNKAISQLKQAVNFKN
jgi:hypothetical protein